MELFPTRCLLLCHSLFTLFSFLLLFCKSSAIGNRTDRLALLAFKEGITDDPLEIMSSWNDSVHFCEWHGVSCSKKHPGRVTILNLGARRLTGILPHDMGNLSFLHLINLTGNFFRGEITENMGRLPRLRYLDLSRNSLEGEIPSSLSNCSRLQGISLGFNHLVGKIPFELSRLASQGLQELRLADNNLTGIIPIWLGNTSSLIRLALGLNNLQGTIPSELGRLSNLQYLLLSSNNLTGTIPSSIYNLSSLQFLDVGNNKLHGRIPPDVGSSLSNLIEVSFNRNNFNGLLPISLSNASRLQRIDFGTNHFTGTVPASLRSLKDLQFLSIGDNYLENDVSEELKFLTYLTNCTKLETLNVRNNSFKGKLPSSIANFSRELQVLTVGHNQVTGTIPGGIENLVGLTALFLDSNSITGKIPEGIGNLIRLQRLNLSGNRISGSIPSTLGNITGMLQLYLHTNDLEGSIPSSLENCQQLELLWLYENRLTGEILKEILSSEMVSLVLHQNFLTGPIPSEIGNMNKLLDLSLTSNRLSGEIPSSIGELVMLERIFLGNNSIGGIIPLGLSNLKSLQVLGLSENNLSGRIPPFLQNLTLLNALNLSYNNLEGEVPQGGIFGNESRFSIVGNGKLCGGLPSLGLPACKDGEPKRKMAALILRITLPIGISCSLILLACLLWLKKKTAKSSSVDLFDKQFVKVSYAELSQATNGFSPSNLICQGGHGSVYKGILRLAGGEMHAAVKVLNLAQNGAARSFLAECNALRNIRHRNLLRIVTACSSIDFTGADFKALVYGWMPRGSLEDWLHLGQTWQLSLRSLSLSERLCISTDVASALEYLHHYCEDPIVHGDLKPSNILLDDGMTAHVGDFGLARILSDFQVQDSSQSTTSSTGFKGTVGYIAPEYGMGGMQSLKGDVYSFGIIILEMLTGKRPTDDMFNNGMDLHQYAEMALPENVAEIIDPSLLLSAGLDGDRAEESAAAVEKTLQCVKEFLRIGIACSMESPGERMNMINVVAEMQRIKFKFFGIRN